MSTEIILYFDGTERYKIKGGMDEVVKVDYFCDKDPSLHSHEQFLLSDRANLTPGRRYKITITDVTPSQETSKVKCENCDDTGQAHCPSGYDNEKVTCWKCKPSASKKNMGLGSSSNENMAPFPMSPEDEVQWKKNMGHHMTRLEKILYIRVTQGSGLSEARKQLQDNGNDYDGEWKS